MASTARPRSRKTREESLKACGKRASTPCRSRTLQPPRKPSPSSRPRTPPPTMLTYLLGVARLGLQNWAGAKEVLEIAVKKEAARPEPESAARRRVSQTQRHRVGREAARVRNWPACPPGAMAALMRRGSPRTSLCSTARLQPARRRSPRRAETKPAGDTRRFPSAAAAHSRDRARSSGAGDRCASPACAW